MISESIDNTDVAEIMIKSQRIGKLKFGVTLDGTQLFVNNSITNWSMTLSCPSTILWTSETGLTSTYVFIADSVKVAGIGHTKQCNDFPDWPPNNSLLLLNSQCPKQLLLNQLYMCATYVFRFWLFTCNKLNVRNISCSWNFLGISKEKNNHFRLT